MKKDHEPQLPNNT